MNILNYNDFVNEKIQVKRKYTDKYPANHVNDTKIRNAILDAVADGVVTDTELIDIINLAGSKAANAWFTANKSLFDVVKNRTGEKHKFKLSPRAEKIWKLGLLDPGYINNLKYT